jgi:AraC-like DNA-binding protein
MDTEDGLARLQGWTSALHGFFEHAAEYSVDGLEILKHFGIPPEAPRPPGCSVPTVSLFGAMRALGEQTNCEGVAYQLLRRQTFRILGSVEHTVRNAPNLGTALTLIEASLHAFGTGYVTLMERVDDVIVIRFTSLLPVGQVQHVQMDYNVGVAVLGIRGLIGREWVPEFIELTRPRPNLVGEWRDYFGCPVRFAADECVMVFSRSDLLRPLTASASGVALTEGERGGVEVDFMHLVDREIMRELSSGNAGLRSVADALGLNVRTVQRRLAAMGSTYQQRLDAVRMAWAQQYLINSQMPLTALGQMLGYGDLATFSRVFKAWFGLAPRPWRKLHQQDSSLS